MPRFSVYLILGAAMCYPAAALDRNLVITIHLYDYSGLQSAMRASAQQSAEAIFRQAGLVIHWKDCAFIIPKTARASDCGAGTEKVTNFVVSVLPEAMAAKLATSPKQFGTSVSGRAGGFPTQAYAFIDRVSSFATVSKSSEGHLLGLIMAHEIGHLLLGADSHSRDGIMRPQWSLEDVQSTPKSVPTFAARQADLLRAEVRRRIEHNQLIGSLTNKLDSRSSIAADEYSRGIQMLVRPPDSFQIDSQLSHRSKGNALVFQ